VPWHGERGTGSGKGNEGVLIGSRMCYRVSSLLNIPIPTLVKVLGLDLPAPPRVSLHGVSADTITLHWSLPEKAGSVAKHIIQINGINGNTLYSRRTGLLLMDTR